MNSGGAKLNIHYGDTEPTDTTSLWIKNAEPTNITIDNTIFGESSYTENYHYLPFPLASATVCKHENNLYIFGGLDVDNLPLNTILVYNFNTKETTTLSAKLKDRKYGMGCAIVNEKIYLMGGLEYVEDSSSYNVSNSVEIFDIATQTITTLEEPLSYYFTRISCCAYKDMIYCFGGETASSSTGSTTPSTNIYTFNTRTNIFTKLSVSLSYPNANSATFLNGENIYLFGGSNSSTKVFKFYIQENKVEAFSNLSYPMANQYFSDSTTDEIYFINPSMIHKYSFVTYKNTLLHSLSSKTNCFVSFDPSYENLLIFGGTQNDVISAYTIKQTLQKDYMHIVTTNNYNKVNLINTSDVNLEIGIAKVYYGDSENTAQLASAYIYNKSSSTWVDVSTSRVT